MVEDRRVLWKNKFVLFVAIIVLLIGGWFGFVRITGVIHVGHAYYTTGHFFKDEQVQKLVSAGVRGDTKEMQELIADGVNVNAIGYQDMTPLMYVLGSKNKVGFESLLQHGANPNFIAKNGMSVVSLLSEGDRPDFLELALKYGGNPNIQDPSDDASGNNETALILAATNGRCDNVKLLLKYGANLEGKDGTGMTALLQAAFTDHYKMAYFLLQQGANYKHVAGYPGTLPDKNGYVYKTDLADLVNYSLHVNSLSLDQVPYRTKILKFLEGKGIKVRRSTY